MKIVDLRKVPQYLETLARWDHAQWSYFSPNLTLERRIKNLKVHLKPQFIPSTFVAVNDELYGSASIVEQDMDTRTDLSPWLASVYVASEFRRRGIGTRLVLHAMTRAKEEGIEGLYLFTPDRQEFYARLGWNTLEETEYHGYPVTVMNVDLSTLSSESLKSQKKIRPRP
jgi:GNAT superfamily N-acetyltransferase